MRNRALADVESQNTKSETTDSAQRLHALDLCVDTEHRKVTFKGNEVTLRPKPYSALVLLMKNSGKPVSKQQLVDAVWQGRIVSDDVITRTIRDIRKALGLSAADKVYIRTLPKIGYQFMPALSLPNTSGVATTAEYAGHTSDTSIENGATTARKVVFAAFIIALVSVAAFIHVQRDLSAERGVFGHIAIAGSDMPQYRALQASVFSQSHGLASLVDNRDKASHAIVITKEETEAMKTWRLAIQDRPSGDEIGVVELPYFDRQRIDEQAEVLLYTTDHMMRCLRDLKLVWDDTSVQDPPRVQAMIIKLCKHSLDFNRFRQIHHVSAEIAAAFPQNASAQALHYLMLVTRSEHFIEGRKDMDTPGYRESLNTLYTHIPSTYEQHRLWSTVHRFHHVSPDDHAALLNALSLVPASDWLSLNSRTTMVNMLRYSGRLKEASAVAEGTSRNWPAFATSRVQNLLANIVTQGFEQTVSIASALPAHQLARIQGPVLSVWSILYANDLAGLKAGMEHAPPVFRQCLLEFVNARQAVHSNVGNSQPLPDSCARMDATMRARMSAILGDDKSSLSILSGFDANAIGPALTLHYPEYDRAWLSEDMWLQAQRLGMVAFWRDTGVRPDICASTEHRKLCDRYLD